MSNFGRPPGPLSNGRQMAVKFCQIFPGPSVKSVKLSNLARAPGPLSNPSNSKPPKQRRSDLEACGGHALPICRYDRLIYYVYRSGAH